MSRHICGCLLLASCLATSSRGAEVEGAIVEVGDGPIAVFMAPVAEVQPQPALDNQDVKPGIVDPQVLALEAQFRPGYESQLHGQLHLIRDLCQPDYEQQVKLVEVGEKAMNKSLRAFAKAQQKMQNGVQVWGGQNASTSDPSKEIVTALTHAVQEIMSVEHAKNYTKVARQRKDFQRQATVDNMVALIDRRLVLSNDQRKRLMKQLLENWQPGWFGNVQFLIHGQAYLPNIPDKAILPVLSEKQKKIWRSVSKNNHFVGHFAMHAHHQVLLEKFKPKQLVKAKRAALESKPRNETPDDEEPQS